MKINFVIIVKNKIFILMKVILYFHENNSVMILLSYRKGRHIHTS